jgi:hypothetical protein
MSTDITIYQPAVHMTLDQSIRAWLDEKRADSVYPGSGRVFALSDEAPIWLSFSDRNKGQAIGVRTLANICEPYLGTSKTQAPRYTLAVEMHKKGAKLTAIQKAQGHSNPAITGEYLEEHLSYENPLTAKLE